MSKAQRAADRYRQQNEMCARIILSDPDRYPGLPQVWAKQFIERSEAPPEDAKAGPLFAAVA
jgi:hypothetical protein